jgi:hypothetical protein
MQRTTAQYHVGNRFTDGNPLTGQRATYVDAAIMNALVDELVHVIEEAGLTLEPGNNTQLRQAILTMITGGGAEITAESVSIDDAGGYFSGLVNVEEALQALGAFMQSGTFAAARSRREVLQLAGVAHQLVAGHYERIIEISHGSACTYTVRDDADVAFPIGGTITIFQAGGGQVEIVQAAGVTVQKGASFMRKTLEQHSSIVLVKTAANTWRMGGIMEAAA